MNSKIKALGLALVAALALTAVMASTASAQFTSSSHHTILSGSQKTGTNDVFSAGSGFGAITCENATFSGTGSATTEETQKITPTYSGCKDSLGRTVHPHNNLTYTFNEKAGTVDLSGSIVLTVTNGSKVVVCTVTVSAQTGVNGISYTNLGGTNGIETTSHSTNVKSTVEGGFFNCGTSTTNATAGTYDGIAVVKGTDTSGAAVSISTD